MAQTPFPQRATDRDSVRTWQYAIAVTLLTYGPLAILSDFSVWRCAAASVCISGGLLMLIDWLRATATPPDSRQRWRR